MTIAQQSVIALSIKESGTPPSSCAAFVFASGCQTGKAPREALAGVCQALVGAEAPLAVGWAASIADDLATNFARMDGSHRHYIIDLCALNK